MEEKSRGEWLVSEVESARSDFDRLPNWKKEMFQSNDRQTRHSPDRDSGGSHPLREATPRQQRKT
jgi:hypothetical protein